LRKSALVVVGILALVSGAAQAAAQDSGWSRFRGPNGSGIANVADLPAEFGPEDAVIWRQAVPRGKSSPVLGERHVFLTAAEAGELVVLAYDRATGALAWRVAIEPDNEADLHPDNDGAVATPATDGENVFVVFATLGVVALNGEGQELWRRPVGPLDSFYGHSASPVLAGDTLVMLFDQRSGSHLLGLDRLTGRELWRRERLARVPSWSTPILYPSDEQPEQILVAGSTWLDAYALETGEPFWELPGLGYWPIASPAVDGGVLVAAAPDQAGAPPETFEAVLSQGDANGDGRMSRDELLGLPRYSTLGIHYAFGDVDDDGHWTRAEYDAVFTEAFTEEYGAVGIRLPASGSVEEPTVIWRDQRAVPYHATPIMIEGLVYLIADNGIVSVLDRDTGELLRRERLSRAGTNVSSSPVLGDGKIYIATADGELYVLRAGADWEVLATNDLAEPMYATPALAPGRIFVRTDGHLYAFGTDPD
jgi:outer membrane protein assembly factor BamB